MNINLFRFVPVLLIVLSVISFNHSAHARGEWTPPVTVDSNNNPLEISAGRTFFNENIYDTFIVLNEGPLPLKSLNVYNLEINPDPQACVLAKQSTITGFDGPIFGSSHRIMGAVPGLFSPTPVFFSSIIDDFRLKVVRSDDGGITWTIHTVDNAQNFGSSEISLDPWNPTIINVGGCNFNNDSYDTYYAHFPYNNFELVRQIPNVDCALTDPVVRSNFAMINGTQYTFYGRYPGGPDQEVFLNIGGQENKIDQFRATPNGTVDESFPSVLLATDYVVGAYFNPGDTSFAAQGSVNAFGVLVGNNNGPIDVRPVGPAPNFTTFFGIAAFESTPGTYDIIYPGGNHFQFSSTTKQSTQINTNGNFTEPDGPIGASRVNTGFFEAFLEFKTIDILQGSKNPLFGGVPAFYKDLSIDCGIFIVPPLSIPTLSEWGLIALAGALMLSGAFYLRRKMVLS